MKRKSCNLFSCVCGCQRVLNTIHDIKCHETWIKKREDEAAKKRKRFRITNVSQANLIPDCLPITLY